jgi:hypothetical protein
MEVGLICFINSLADLVFQMRIDLLHQHSKRALISAASAFQRHVACHIGLSDARGHVASSVWGSLAAGVNGTWDQLFATNPSA